MIHPEGQPPEAGFPDGIVSVILTYASESGQVLPARGRQDMYCAKCGKELREGGRSCLDGTPDHPAAELQVRHGQKKMWI